MGRFSLTEIDDHDECWEFVADRGEEGALVIRDAKQRSRHSDDARLRRKHSSDVVDYVVDSRQPRSSSRIWWNVSIAVILVGWLFQRYLPPAPPPSLIALVSDADDNNDTTWTAFLSHHSFHLIHSFVTLTVHVPWHISQWLLLTLSTDVHLAWERYRESSTCRIRERPATDMLPQFLVGQQTALRIVSDTIVTWKSSQPLLFLFTGLEHTGKTTLAHALMEHVLLEDSCSDPLKRILVMEGRDLSDDRDMLMHPIVRHVNSYASGSMILIQHVEDMEAELLIWLVRTLFALSSDASVIHPNEHQWNDCCPNTVFVFSSDTVGRNAIARALRQDNMHPTDAVFLADLYHSVDSHFDQFQSRSWLDAVVPFQPLTRDSLGDALSLKVSQLVPNMVITEKAKEAILDPTRVEYLEWKRRDRPEDDPVYFMTVAIHGAQILEEKSSPLWKQLRSRIQQCPQVAETVTMDYVEGEIVLQACQDGGTCDHIIVCSFSIT